jgi:hypothetical protein
MLYTRPKRQLQLEVFAQTNLLPTSGTKVMSSSKLQRRAKANVASKSTLVIWGATETLQ